MTNVRSDSGGERGDDAVKITRGASYLGYADDVGGMMDQERAHRIADQIERTAYRIQVAGDRVQNYLEAPATTTTLSKSLLFGAAYFGAWYLVLTDLPIRPSLTANVLILIAVAVFLAVGMTRRAEEDRRSRIQAFAMFSVIAAAVCAFLYVMQPVAMQMLSIGR